MDRSEAAACTMSNAGDRAVLLPALAKPRIARRPRSPKHRAERGSPSSWSAPWKTRGSAAARESVFAETRRLLRERLRLSTGELESLIRAVRSQLDVSITGLLRTVNR